MADDDTPPPRPADPPVTASTSDAAWIGTQGPTPTPPATPPATPPSAGDGRIWVPPGGTLPAGWYGSPPTPGWRNRTRALVTRRVPILAAALALLVGLGVGGGTAFAVADGHGGGPGVVGSRGDHGAGDDQRRPGR